MGDCRGSLHDLDKHRHPWQSVGELGQDPDQCTQKSHQAYWRHTKGLLSSCCARSSLSQWIHPHLQRDLDGEPLLVAEWAYLRRLSRLSSRLPKLDGTTSVCHHSLTKERATLAHSHGWQASGESWLPKSWSLGAVAWGTGATWNWTADLPGVSPLRLRALPALAIGDPWRWPIGNCCDLECLTEDLDWG